MDWNLLKNAGRKIRPVNFKGYGKEKKIPTGISIYAQIYSNFWPNATQDYPESNKYYSVTTVFLLIFAKLVTSFGSVYETESRCEEGAA
ncbi:hypothetical protein [Massilia sp. LjRoot122]|uniref:hypothetical protein n=1 Tax=Massilia sp. LjRoot122 TaxID=3342257 RepID=UPI003ECE3510